MKRSHSTVSFDDLVCTPPERFSSPETVDGEVTSYMCSKETYTTNKEHVKLVCENLISTGKYERLERFLWAIPDMKEFGNTEIVLVAQSYIAFRNGNFNKLYELLQHRTYNKKYHRQLQYLWRTARYIEAERARGRALGSVGKYRIRRKYPLPYTIWDGECMSYCFREEAREILNTMYKRSPYPSAKEKYAIAQEAKLSVTQVSNWFKNKRQRARAKSADKKRSLVSETEKRLKSTHHENGEDQYVKSKEDFFPPAIMEKKDSEIKIEMPRRSIPSFTNSPYKSKLYPANPYPITPYTYPMAFPIVTKYRLVPTPVLYRMPATPAHLLISPTKLRIDDVHQETPPPSFHHRHLDELCEICMTP